MGQIFGEGGGGEAQRSEFLGGLIKRRRQEGGRRLFNDLSEHRDADSPATIDRTFNYGKVPKKTPGAVILNRGSFKPVETAGASAVAARATPKWASNFLILGRQRSATGHPLFVAGPQIGYFYPGLTLEADISWPGGQARGVYSPGSPGSILIGRGQDFAWSLTSAGSDLIDEYAEELCGGSKTKYRYKGKCRKMGSVDAGTIQGEGRVKYRTTVHGPVTGYAKWGKKQVAITRKRSSFGRDILFQLPFRDATAGQDQRDQVVRQGVRALAVHVQRRLRGRPRHRDVLGGPAAQAREGRRLASAHARHRQVRVERLPQDRRPPAGGQPVQPPAAELEQRAGARLGRRRQQLVLRLAAPRVAAAEPDRAHARRTTWPR